MIAIPGAVTSLSLLIPEARRRALILEKQNSISDMVHVKLFRVYH